MNDLTMQEKWEADSRDLAFSIRYACAVGGGRQIEMGGAIPIDWGKERLDGLLDKMAGAMDRQQARYQLIEDEKLLEQAERQLVTNRQQLANYQTNCMREWEGRSKKGEWQASESQRKQMDNFKNNSQHLTDEIKRLRVKIEETSAKCR